MSQEARSRVAELQTKLHRWAVADGGCRFDDLFNLVCDPAFLRISWDRVASNKGARSAGVDGKTADSIERSIGVKAFLEDLRSRLKEKSFSPSPVREKMIPKANGKLRRLGIPTVEDRVVQGALKLVLEPIFEADFKPCSYGFRPRRRAHDAIAEIRFLASCSYEWVLEADVEACFDNISHSFLMDRVRKRVGDKRVLRLVRKFLKAGILTELGMDKDTHTGTPQGGILSPLLANIALSALDEHFAGEYQQEMATSYQRKRRRRQGLGVWRICRYADLCRRRHKSAYAELRIMPASSEFSLVKSGRSSYGIGIILRVRQRPGFLVRVSDSSGQEDDHGDEHSSRRRSAGRGQHGASGGVRQVAGPGTGPVAGVGAVLFQAVEGVPDLDRRGRGGQRPGRGQGDRVHGGLDGGTQHVDGEGDGDVAAGPAGPARSRGRRAPARRHRLAGRRDHGHRQGQPDRAAPAAGPGRGGPGRLAEGRPAVLRAAVGVRDDPAAPPAHDAGAGPGHHGQGLRAGRPGADGSSPPAALPGDRDAAGRGLAARGRAGAPPPQHAVHLDLCQGRPERAAPAGAALAGERGMSGLRTRAEEYLAMRRALGFKLTSHGSRLMSFIRFCEDRGATTVTTDLAVEWATSTPSDHEAYQARRLDIVRIFARHLQPLDPATEVPPEDVLDRRQWRIPPYLYSPQEVTALMTAARTLRPAFRAKTWRTLIGLLAVTGMRQGEACRLARGDVDLNAETVTIADSKFGKSRMVFLHPTAAAALRAYDRARDEAFPGAAAGTFLVNSRGGPLDSHNTSKTFAVLVTTTGIKAPPGQRAPRLHDLRHYADGWVMRPAVTFPLAGAAELVLQSA